MEKYYDLIVSLIKANRKYPGCEAILEDIVADVYSHAEVVLGNVTNESVVSSYLNKLVTTSMITVPRRLGIQSKKLRSITKELPIQTESVTEALEDDLSLNEDLSQETELLESDNINELPEATEIEDLSEDELVEEMPLNDEVTAEELENNSPAAFVPEVNKDLVDKMINGISSDERGAELDIDLDTKDTELLAEEDEGSLEELPEEEGLEPAAEDTELLAEEDEGSLEELPEEESLEPAAEDTELLAEEDEGSLEELPEEEDLEPAAEDTELLAEEDESSLEELPEKESLEDDTENLLQGEESEDLLAEPEYIAEDGTSLEESQNYKYFEFSPQKVETDYSELIPRINNIQSMHEDINIMEIMKLKYQDRLSISDIASKLDLTEETVLDALKEVIYLVKE